MLQTMVLQHVIAHPQFINAKVASAIGEWGASAGVCPAESWVHAHTAVL